MKYLLSTLLVIYMIYIGAAQADPVTLSWDAYQGTIAGFKVYKSTTPGVYGTPMTTIASATATSHTFDIPQAQLATTYYFTLTAYKLSGVESVKSNEVSKVISAIPVIAVIPNPGSVVLSIDKITQSGVEVSWLPVDDGTGTPAKIDVRIGSSTTSWGSMVSQVCPLSPCTITGLTPETPYKLQAVAWRPDPIKNVFGLLSEIVAFSTLLSEVDPIPTPPVGLKVTKAESSQIIISALVKDCPHVITSTKGSTSMVSVRTVSCVQ